MYPRVITVSAIYAEGDRGIQADLPTLAALGCRCAVVATAVVTPGAAGANDEVHTVPPRVVAAQLEAALAGPVDAAKVGAVVDTDILGVVTAAARAGRLPRLVIDPVLTALPGRRRGLVEGYRRLLEYATVATPNADEASALADWPMTAPVDLAGAAGQIAAHGVPVVAVTGGALPGDEVVDMVWAGTGVRRLHGRRVPGAPVRGAGCAFAAAVAAQLAHGQDPAAAVEHAKLYTSRAISGATGDSGVGALDYFEQSAFA
jgi:hydroxymethylpyrimidine kinase/phosphomethylpyrimidine kinase